jgi:hypothetical protein
MKKQTLSWREHIKRIEYFDKRRAIRNKRMNEIFNKVFDKCNNIFWSIIKILSMVFISVFAGQGSEPIIYILNKPFGLGYAHFASYAISALTMLILYSSVFKEQKA